MLLALLALYAPAQALLMGENAKTANITNLNIAERMYRRGASHAEVWRRTGWHCANRKRGTCRWELRKKCHDISLFHLVPLRHSAFTGERFLFQVLGSSCLFLAYPEMRKKVRIYDGDCRGYWGLAHHDGRVCVNLRLIEANRAEGERAAYLVLLHEIQHQIQYVEGWPKSRHDCDYDRRAIEAEAREAQRRAWWEAEKRRHTPPRALASGGLCY